MPSLRGSRGHLHADAEEDGDGVQRNGHEQLPHVARGHLKALKEYRDLIIVKASISPWSKHSSPGTKRQLFLDENFFISTRSAIQRSSCVLFLACVMLAGSKTKHTKLLPQADERRCKRRKQFCDSSSESPLVRSRPRQMCGMQPRTVEYVA